MYVVVVTLIFACSPHPLTSCFCQLPAASLFVDNHPPPSRLVLDHPTILMSLKL